MRPRSVNLEDERARLESELRASARAAQGPWERISTSGQTELLAQYRRDRKRILLRLRQLRRIEKYRRETDVVQRIAKESAA
jgi:hypothetical protein